MLIIHCRQVIPELQSNISFLQYLLEYAPFSLKDSSGCAIDRSPFDVKRAARNFKIYVRENENLLRAKLVNGSIFLSSLKFFFFIKCTSFFPLCLYLNSLIHTQIIIPHFFNNHHTVYVMNRYKGSLDIFDSRKYTRWSPQSRNTYHGHRVEIVSWVQFSIQTMQFFVKDSDLSLFCCQMRRMVSLMKEVYGTAEYNKHNEHQWEVLAERCTFVPTPEQGANECGFYALKVAYNFDGEKLVEEIVPKDVSIFSYSSCDHVFSFCCLCSATFTLNSSSVSIVGSCGGLES